MNGVMYASSIFYILVLFYTCDQQKESSPEPFALMLAFFECRLKFDALELWFGQNLNKSPSNVHFHELPWSNTFLPQVIQYFPKHGSLL